MKKIMVYWTSRSEEGILTPVVKRLEEDPDIQCIPLRPKHLRGTDPAKLGETYSWAYENIEFYAPDLVIAPFDRPEMLMVAIAAMTQNVPVCQIHAGDLSGEGTYDDKTRYAITMIADLLFCNGETAHRRVGWMSWLVYGNASISFLGKTSHDVGSTSIDDIEPDYSLVPYYDSSHVVFQIGKGVVEEEQHYTPFDLVLYNPETATDKDEENLFEIFRLLTDPARHVVWIGPNGDPGSEGIVRGVRGLPSFTGRIEGHVMDYYDSVPRAQFLGLVQKAERLIGNSSAFCVETPLLRDDWEEAVILVGTRNTPDRFLRDSRPGGSDRIHQEIRRFLKLSPTLEEVSGI